MKSINEKVIYCEVKNIYKPKPKRLFKINDCFKGHSKFKPGQKRIPNYNKDIHQKKIWGNNNKNKLNKRSLESISLEEIENDFKLFKAKSEAIKVENELMKILLEPSNREKHNNIMKAKRKLNSEENKCNINIEDNKLFINK